MEVEIKLDSTCRQPRAIITTASLTEEVERVVRLLEEGSSPTLAGFRDGRVSLLEPREILRIYASQGKVLAVTEEGEFSIRARLYELEQRLEPERFVRISNSELINLRRVRSFDLSLAGTIRVFLSDGQCAYVSRRYVTKIKQMLGL